VTPGRYLRLRRQAAGLGLADLPIRGLSALVIERDVRPATIIEVDELRCAFQFDTQILAAIGRGTIPRLCSVCGCSELDACWDELTGGCHWVEQGLCSACADDARCLPEGPPA
jgi:hypothetical protein